MAEYIHTNHMAVVKLISLYLSNVQHMCLLQFKTRYGHGKDAAIVRGTVHHVPRALH